MWRTKVEVVTSETSNSLFPSVSIKLQKPLPKFYCLRPTASCPVSRKSSAENYNLESRDGTLVRAITQVWFQPGATCGLSLLLVLALLWEFFSSFCNFPPSTKTNISNFEFDRERWPIWKPATTGVASYLNIVFFLLFPIAIYLLTFFQ